MTASKLFTDSSIQLQTIYDDREARQILEWIFENVTHLKTWERRMNPNWLIPEQQFQLIQQYVAELMKHKPIQYVLNEAWFYKMKLYVDESVLIPRPETEELVAWIVEDYKTKKHNLDSLHFIDCGTGSGCIPIALKKEFPTASVKAIDVSKQALTVAQKNAQDQHTDIELIELSLLNEHDWNFTEKFDVIVSNPPYIPIHEKTSMASHVTKFEPGLALFVPNDNPFVFYEKLAKMAQLFLKEEGKLYVEIHENYAADVQTIFQHSGFKVHIKKDIYGKERMVRAQQ